MAATAVNNLQFNDQRKHYIIGTLDPILEELVQHMLDEMPPDPHAYLIMQLRKRQGLSLNYETNSLRMKNEQLRHELNSCLSFVEEAVGGYNSTASQATEESSAEEDDDEDFDENWQPPAVSSRPRTSVSAEAYGDWNRAKVFKPPVYEKSEEQQASLKEVLSKSFLFKKLDDGDMGVIVAAMKEVAFDAGTRIITEGDDGDHLFVIVEGSPVCKKLIDGELKVVKECFPGDVFGELALLYNAPRAATVDATDACRCWQLDRETFSYILKSGATQRMTIREDQLKNVTLFLGLQPEERLSIVAALKRESYNKGDVVIRQGDQGDKFYIVDSGELTSSRVVDGEERQRMQYRAGDYFGELALLKNQPRAATMEVVSESATVMSLDRKTFNKMLGPLESLLNRQEDYVS
eukprot:TRINITY_DN30424_c0_g1_i1.p1 TRINITY_DN30424_c0_g1~~TRINITY_DN30424_c0_g1_i1.p1  ORF type:complete len:407 (+),score=142.71 TRINITY_DN30424_c0_g1_i1:82-1302(+)